MSKKIKLYTLEGCKKCKYIKDSLTKMVYFEEVMCEQDGKSCDRVETEYGCEIYPVVEIISNATAVGSVDKEIDVVYCVDRVEDLGGQFIVRTGEGNIATGPCHDYITLHRVYSKETLLEVVLKLLH